MALIRPKTTLPSLLLLLLIIEFATIFWAASPSLAAQHAGYSTLLFIVFIVPAWWLAQPQRKAERRLLVDKLIVLIGCILVLNSVVGLLQFWQQGDLGLWWLGELKLEPVGGFSVVEQANKLTLRAYGLTRHPNSLGGLLMVGFLLLLPRALLQRQPWAIAVVVLTLAGLVVTFSRSSWLGTLVATVPLLLLWSAQHGVQPALLTRRSAAAFGLGGLLLLGMMASSNRRLIAARLSTESTAETRSLQERSVLITQSAMLIEQAPLHGVGAGNFVFMLPDDLMEHPQPVHNMILLISAEIGLPAGILWLLITLLPLIISYQAWRSGRLSANGCAITAALLACAVTDQLDMYAWQWVTGRSMRWLLFGLWLMTVPTALSDLKASS